MGLRPAGQTRLRRHRAALRGGGQPQSAGPRPSFREREDALRPIAAGGAPGRLRRHRAALRRGWAATVLLRMGSSAITAYYSASSAAVVFAHALPLPAERPRQRREPAKRRSRRLRFSQLFNRTFHGSGRSSPEIVDKEVDKMSKDVDKSRYSVENQPADDVDNSPVAAGRLLIDGTNIRRPIPPCQDPGALFP